MIAALGMYDLGPLQDANDRLWAAIRDGLRAHGVAAPEALVRGAAAYWDGWHSPDLVLSQTCGYPYRARLHGTVTLIGTPDYGLEGCPPGYYRSVFVARRDDPRADLAAFSGARFAYNEPLSQSGWAAPQTHAAAVGVHLPPAVQTGAHRLSALAVAEGQADLAAIDALTWELLVEHDPFTVGLKVVGQTTPTPGLPLIAALGADRSATFAAVAQAIAGLSAADRALLHLRGIVAIAAADYLAVPIPPAPEAPIPPAPKATAPAM